jgi:hypothetical protein
MITIRKIYLWEKFFGHAWHTIQWHAEMSDSNLAWCCGSGSPMDIVHCQNKNVKRYCVGGGAGNNVYVKHFGWETWREETAFENCVKSEVDIKMDSKERKKGRRYELLMLIYLI